MNQGKMIFAQLIEVASYHTFKYCVERYKGNYKAKDFSCWKQFLCMSFGQLTQRQSLSDTALCLKLQKDKLYHLGIGKAFDKSTISRANENRDWRIFRDFALKLIEQAKELSTDVNLPDLKLKGNIYALDSTTIDLCLDVFWWASFRTHKGAIKLHTLLDLKTAIPEYIFISEGTVHDVNALDYFSLPSGSYLVMDKAYVDFSRLWQFSKERTTFVLRSKDNMTYNVICKATTDKTKGVLSDQTIELNGIRSKYYYPDKLRKVCFYDKETDNTFTFITNNFKLSALTVAALYKSRWGIETFFKWIKQHLKILNFWGYTENAVRTQIWIAISTYVIIIIAKKKFQLSQSLYEILQLVSISVFDRTPIKDLFNKDFSSKQMEDNPNQLKMF